MSDRHGALLRASMTAALCAALLPTAAGAATADARTLRLAPLSAAGGTAVGFPTTALRAVTVTSSRLVAGRRTATVPAAAVRTASRSGRTLRVKVPATWRRAKVAPRSIRLVVAVRKPAKTSTGSTPVAEPATAVTTAVTETVAAVAGPVTSAVETVVSTVATALPAAGSGSCAVDLQTLGGLQRPPACWRPYAATSPFNRRLPASPKLASGSAAIVSRVLGFGPIEALTAGKATSADNDYGRPVYFARASDPGVVVHCTESWGRCPVEGMTVRIPAGASAASGSDGHLAVVDTTTGWEYDFWRAGAVPAAGGTLNVAWGGRSRLDGDGLGGDGTAAQFGEYAGVVRLEELQAGRIDHALFMYAECDSGTFVYPATKTGQSCSAVGKSNTGAPPMGTRLQLGMSDAEIAALPVPAWKKTILTAMAHYGLIMGDTGGTFGIKEESARVYTTYGASDKWLDWSKTQPGVTSWDGISYFDLAGGVDWQKRLRVVAPCVSQGTC